MNIPRLDFAIHHPKKQKGPLLLCNGPFYGCYGIRLNELHHAAHAAHAVHTAGGHRGFFLLFGQIADHAFGRQ